MPVIAGSGGNSTTRSVALSRAAVEAGADALLVVTPYYNRPTQEGLYRHFTAIADAAGAPVILYNVPSRTSCDLLPETVARLATHPRIIGIKEATGDVARGEAVRRLCPEDFLLLSGDDPTAVALMRIGARGVISVTANVVPRAMHEVCTAALAGRFDQAAALDRQHRTAAPGAVRRAEPDPGEVGCGADGADRGGNPPSADAAQRGAPRPRSRRPCARRASCCPDGRRVGSLPVSGLPCRLRSPSSRRGGRAVEGAGLEFQ